MEILETNNQDIRWKQRFQTFTICWSAGIHSFWAKGNFKPGSDIDLAVKGPVSKDTLSALLTAFEESLLPYFVDVVIYEHITNEALREHIDRVGISIYKS